MIYYDIPPMGKHLGCDLETTDLDPFLGNILSAAFSDGTDVWIITHDFERLQPVLTDPDTLKIFHNAKFDMSWFKVKLGIEVQPIACTYLAETVWNAGRVGYLASYQASVKHWLDIDLVKETRLEFAEHPGFDVHPMTPEQEQYIALDVLHLPALYEAQKKDLQELLMWDVVDKLENPAVAATVELEMGGFWFDVDAWDKAVAWMEGELERIDHEIRALIGLDYILEVPATRKGEAITKMFSASALKLNSPTHITALINKRFGYKATSTRASELERMTKLKAAKYKEVARFAGLLLEHRRWEKRIGFKYASHIHPVTGRIMAEFKQLGARTGRYSCKKPNMQQVPRPAQGEPNFRQMFVAPLRHVIMHGDYGQQEPRIMAQVSGDTKMIEACNKQDVYIEFARPIFGHEVEKGSEERHIAKTFVLAVAFGARPKELSRASSKPIAQCEDIRNKILRAFPAMAGFGRRMETFLHTYGYVPTITGRRRYVTGLTEATNTPIQGTAADMFKLALSTMHQRLTELKKSGTIQETTRIYHIVHDEICLVVHQDDVTVVETLLNKTMYEAGKQLCPDVEHIVEIGTDTAWDK